MGNVWSKCDVQFIFCELRAPKDGIVHRAVTLGRCVLVARGWRGVKGGAAGRGAVIVARAYCRLASICQHCVSAPRIQKTCITFLFRNSNCVRSRSVRTNCYLNGHHRYILICVELLFIFVLFFCLCVIFFFKFVAV